MANAEQQVQPEDLQNIFNDLVRGRERLVRFLLEAATELDGHHKNVKITKVVTGSTGVFGTIISLVGLLFAVPTGGLSLAFTVGGGALAAASGVANLGSGVVEQILTQSYIDKLDELSRADEENYNRFDNYLAIYIEELRDNAFNNNISPETGFEIIRRISSLASLGCSIIRVTRDASTAALSIRVFGAASAVLGGVTLPFQIIDLAMDGRALNTNERSENADKLRQLAQGLTYQLNNLGQYLRNLINQCEQQLHQQANNEDNRHGQQPQQLPNHQDNRPTVSIFNPITVVFVPFFVIVISLITKKVFEVGFGVFFN